MKKFSLLFVPVVAFSLLSWHLACCQSSSGSNPDPRFEIFYIAAGGGILSPMKFSDEHEGDNFYTNMLSGYNYLLKAGFRIKVSDIGALNWSFSYADSKNDYAASPSLNFSAGNVHINRYDITLLDPMLLFGKYKQGYYHIGINLILNQNTFSFHTDSSPDVHNIKDPREAGIGFETGFHIAITNHVGITLDAGMDFPGYEETESTFYFNGGGSYTTNSATSSGTYYYVNAGLLFGIW